MAYKSRTGEIFIIRGPRKNMHSCWVVCDQFYDTRYLEHIYIIRVLHEVHVSTHVREEAFGSDIKMLARRKSTRIVKFDDL